MDDKIDETIKYLRYLEIIQKKLIQHVYNNNDNLISNITESLQLLINDFSNYVYGTKMVPICQSFCCLQRLVTALSSELDKRVTFFTFGGEIEITDSFYEKIKELLIHILINIIIHDIEHPDERNIADKPANAEITLSVKNSEGQILIIIKDDGKGIKWRFSRGQMILHKQRKDTNHLSDESLFNLFLKSGFSTAAAISKITDQGVEMDIIAKELSNLQGNITYSYKKNKYSKIIISIPFPENVINIDTEIKENIMKESSDQF